jgi:lipoteichoic acid synthase
MKRRIIYPELFYLIFSVLNLINAFVITSGIFHPNISPYKMDILSLMFSTLGNIGVLSLIVIFSLVVFKSTKKRLNFLVIITFVLSAFCIFLAVFGNIFGLFFDFQQLKSFNNPSEGVFILYYLTYALHMLTDISQFAHLIPFILIIIVRLLTDTSLEPKFKLHRLQAGALTFVNFLFMAMAIMFTLTKVSMTPYKDAINPIFGSTNAGLYNYYIYDLLDYLVEDNEPISLEDHVLITEFLNKKNGNEHINPIDGKTYQKENEYTGLAEGMNLIAIQLESFTSLLIDLEVNGIEITPNINQIVKKSRYYDNFYSTSGIGNTSDAEFSFNTGLYGNGRNLTIFDYVGDNYPTIARGFNKKGYDTFSLNGDEGEFYNRYIEHQRTFGYNRYYDCRHFEGEYVHGFINDYDLLDQTADMILAEEGPFFNFIITSTSHSPYMPHPSIPQYDYGKVSNLVQNFLDYMIYLDECIGAFMKKIEPILDNTVVIFYGDHSSSLFKKDLETIWGRSIKKYELRYQMQKVPFFIYNEKLFEPAVDNTAHGTVDIFPTMVNLFGLDPVPTLGFDMLGDEAGFVYSPRTYDIFFDDFTLAAPSKTTYRKEISKEEIDKYYQIWSEYIKINNLILKTGYYD